MYTLALSRLLELPGKAEWMLVRDFLKKRLTISLGGIAFCNRNYARWCHRELSGWRRRKPRNYGYLELLKYFLHSQFKGFLSSPCPRPIPPRRVVQNTNDVTWEEFRKLRVRRSQISTDLCIFLNIERGFSFTSMEHYIRLYSLCYCDVSHKLFLNIKVRI